MAKVYSTVFWQRIRLPQMGPQDLKDVTRAQLAISLRWSGSSQS